MMYKTPITNVNMPASTVLAARVFSSYF